MVGQPRQQPQVAVGQRAHQASAAQPRQARGLSMPVNGRILPCRPCRPWRPRGGVRLPSQPERQPHGLPQFVLGLGNKLVREQLLLEHITTGGLEYFIDGTCHENLKAVAEMFVTQGIVSKENIDDLDILFIAVQELIGIIG